MAIRQVLLACAMGAALPAIVSAQPLSGPYVSLGAGVNLQQNEIVTPAPALGFLNDVHYKFHPGFAGTAAAGYGLGNGVRVEIEGDYISNKVRGADALTDTGLNLPRHAGGLERKYGGFLNVLYDVPLGLPVQPYVGVGAGGMAVEHTGFNQGVDGVALAPPPPIPGGKPFGFHDQTVGGFAYQGIAGLSVPLGFLPGLSFTAEYHFIGLLDPLPAFQLEQSRFVNVFAHCPPMQACPTFVYRKQIEVSGNRHFTNDFNHNITLGFRYALFQPRPPTPAGDIIAPPPPNAPAARTYLVFFDWDRADLTARARQIVAQAASAAQSGTTRIEVDGYTDLSGTAAYNQRLSVRRATAVKVELVRDGVAAGEIAIAGRGESNPLVPTAAGVREPQNRRVEIVLR